MSTGPVEVAMRDRYTILFSLGEGGMGTVDAAIERGPGKFKRRIALKRVRTDAARGEEKRLLFEREARLAALLNHPNVVRTIEFGEAEGQPFLALEFIDGVPLSEFLKTNRAITQRLTCFILAEVCAGLHAVHELRDVDGKALSVVHRDVSPQNVMLSRDGRVLLLDLGISKTESDSTMTRTGEVRGKLAYMAPEQAMGDPVDRTSDLYGLGSLLYECLTGERMWGTGTEMEVMRRLALEDAPTLPCPDAKLVTLHASMTARDPKSRPRTALEVESRLRALISDAAAIALKDELAAAIELQFRERFLEIESRFRTAIAASVRPPSPTAAEEEGAPETMREEVDVVAESNVPATRAHWLIRSPKRSVLPWLAVSALIGTAVAFVQMARAPHRPVVAPDPGGEPETTAQVSSATTSPARNPLPSSTDLLPSRSARPQLLPMPSSKATARGVTSATGSARLLVPTASASASSNTPATVGTLGLDGRPF